MKTLKHKLLSLPGKEIEISEEYAETADNIIRDLKASKSQDDIRGVLNVYGYAWDATMNDYARGILESTEDSSYHKRSIDKIYIKLGKEALNRDNALGKAKLEEEYIKKNKRFVARNGIKYARLNSAFTIIENESMAEWKKKSGEGK
jgi:hypothetical protein